MGARKPSAAGLYLFPANSTSEGFVLLKNKNNALPLASSEKNLTVLGAAQTNVAYGGSGSGAQGTPGLAQLRLVFFVINFLH